VDAVIWIVRLFRACRPGATLTTATHTATLTPNTAALTATVPGAGLEVALNLSVAVLLGNGAGAHFCDEEDHVTDLLTVKRGDTAPPLTLTLTDNDVPVDLTGATVRVIGVVRPWAAVDTATVRDLTVEAEVTWPDLSVQTFPAEGSLTVRIVPDLA
jgi:hypothetical protein